MTEGYNELLRIANQERLQQLLQREKGAFAYDIHGFMMGKPHQQDITDANLDLLAELLVQGTFLAAVTGFGDRIHFFHTDRIQERIEQKGLDPANVPFYISTRNSALTQHAFTREVIDHHPITDATFNALYEDELFQAIYALTSDEAKARLETEYKEKEALGFTWDAARIAALPHTRLDRCAETGEGYQITLMYEPDKIKQVRYDLIAKPMEILLGHTSGILPATPHDLAPILQAHLASKGIVMATNTAGSHPEIDLAMPGVSKAHGCEILLPYMATHLGVTAQEVPHHMVAGGDSPLHNDKPLIEFAMNGGGFGVTNIDHFTEDGPIVLDFEGVNDPLMRTNEFLQRLNHT